MCLEVSEVTLQIYGRDSKARLNGADTQRGETQDGKNPASIQSPGSCYP